MYRIKEPTIWDCLPVDSSQALASHVAEFSCAHEISRI